jgi:hypothetical protein
MRLSNKELKLTKPSIMELRSLTPVFGRQVGVHHAATAPGVDTARASLLRTERLRRPRTAFRLAGYSPFMRGSGCCVSIVWSRGRQDRPSTSGVRPYALDWSVGHGDSRGGGAAASPALPTEVARRATPSRVG